MASKTAFNTDKLSHSESYILNVSAFTACHRSPSRIYFHQLGTACYSFVFQTFDESAPRSVRYMLSEMMVSNHVRNLQTLDSDKEMRFGYFIGQLESKIKPLVADFFIQPAQSEPCLSSVGRVFDFSANPAMQDFQSAFRFRQITRISYKFSIRQSSKVFQANINADFRVRIGMNNIAFRHFTAESGKPLSRFSLLDGKSFNLAFRNPVKNDWQVANLTDLNMLVADELKPRLRISDATNSGFVARKTFLFSVFPDTPKEVLERFMHSVRNILLGLRMNIIKSSSKILVEVKLVKSYISEFVSILVKGKKFVINSFASDERTNEFFLLPFGRIHAIFETEHSEMII